MVQQVIRLPPLMHHQAVAPTIVPMLVDPTVAKVLPRAHVVVVQRYVAQAGVEPGAQANTLYKPQDSYPLSPR